MRNVENNNEGEIVNIVSKNKKGVNLQETTSPEEPENNPDQEVQPKPEVAQTTQPKESKANKKLYLPIIAFVLLILIGFFAFFFFK